MVITIGFEGLNRVGKGTQIGLLSAFLHSQDSTAITLRGDGSRPAVHPHSGATSAWWLEMNRQIHASKEGETWSIAGCRLARELLIWRNRYLPRILRASGQEKGFVLLDRTILSRCACALEYGENDINNLYAADKKLRKRAIGYIEVCPDIIFHLIAPKAVLLDRLDPEDPKYQFRRSLIERPDSWYEKAITAFPTVVTERIVTIDATPSPEAVFQRIIETLTLRSLI